MSFSPTFSSSSSSSTSSSSSSSSSSSTSYSYRCSASHHKTLAVLGKVKNFNKLGVNDLLGYCGLVRHEDGCQSASEAASRLESRFGWPTSTRMDDIEAAWRNLVFGADGGDDEEEEEVEIIPAKSTPKTTITKATSNGGAADDEVVVSDSRGNSKKATSAKKDDKEKKDEKDGKKTSEKKTEKSASPPLFTAGSIPVIIKSNAWDKKILLCEVDDAEFNIAGDSGAVGRITVDTTDILIDVKGELKINSSTIFIHFVLSRPPCTLLSDRTTIQRQDTFRSNSNDPQSRCTDRSTRCQLSTDSTC